MLKLAEGSKAAVSHRDRDHLLINGVALAVLLIGVLILLSWLGVDLGWHPWLACQLTGLRMDNSLLQFGILIGLGLCIISATRSAGIGLVILGIAVAYGLELLSGATLSACGGVSTLP